LQKPTKFGALPTHSQATHEALELTASEERCFAGREPEEAETVCVAEKESVECLWWRWDGSKLCACPCPTNERGKREGRREERTARLQREVEDEGEWEQGGSLLGRVQRVEEASDPAWQAALQGRRGPGTAARTGRRSCRGERPAWETGM